ncbi:hypothetical protein BIW11_04281, partial [Tropilaelaps mercedesae]
DKQAGGQISG